MTSIFSKELGLRTQTPPDALKTQRAPGKVQVHLFVLSLQKDKAQSPFHDPFSLTYGERYGSNSDHEYCFDHVNFILWLCFNSPNVKLSLVGEPTDLSFQYYSPKPYVAQYGLYDIKLS